MKSDDILELLKVTDNSLCLSAAEIIENQKKQIETLYKAIEILKHGWGGHLHWDPTRRHGAGCDLCKMWWDALDEVDILLGGERISDDG
ncbi:MAG: hypothetical protein WC057_08635 [Dehalococcoidales bacterium]